MAILQNEIDVGSIPVEVYRTSISTNDEGTVALLTIDPGVRVLDAYVERTTAGSNGTNSITGNIGIIGGGTTQVLFTNLSLTTTGRVDLGEGSHANPGAVINGTTQAEIQLYSVAVSETSTIATEAVMNVNFRLVRENWPSPSVNTSS